MDEKQELKPCPFCGGDNISPLQWPRTMERCNSCGAKGPDTWLHSTWNTRAVDPAWKYVERDGNPTEEDEYLIAVNITEPGVTRDYWGRFGWRHYCNEDVYAWAECRPMPEPPPLLEGENG